MDGRILVVSDQQGCRAISAAAGVGGSGAPEAFYNGTTAEPIKEISWARLSHRLGTREDVERLLTFHFQELSEWFDAVHQPSIWAFWRTLRDSDGKITRNEAALLVLICALAGLMVPPAAPLVQQNSQKPREKHRDWFLLADEILEEGKDALSPDDNSLDRLLCDCAMLMYTSFAGHTLLKVSLLHTAVSRAHYLHLFDDSHRAWHGLSDLQREYRRRVVAHLITTDRWYAFHQMRPFVIHPSTIKVDPPTYEPDTSFNPTTGARLIEAPIWNMTLRVQRGQLSALLLAATTILHEMHDSSVRPMERYTQIHNLDSLANANWEKTLREMGISGEMLTQDYGGAVPVPSDAQLRRLSLPCMMSVGVNYICTMAYRPLLEDPKAPIDMRFRAFVKAQKILDSLPLM